ncbi:hypothetical protein MASR1M32_39200 [Rhodobacter sp.]
MTVTAVHASPDHRREGADPGRLARALGHSEADARTFDLVPRPTVAGETYARAAGLVTAGRLLPVYGPLIEPEWGADTSAALDDHGLQGGRRD